MAVFFGVAVLADFLGVALVDLSAAGVEPTCLASWDFIRAALFGSMMPHLAALSIIEKALLIVLVETPFKLDLRAVLRRRLISVFFSATRRAFLADLEIGISSKNYTGRCLTCKPFHYRSLESCFFSVGRYTAQDMETTPKAQAVELIKQAKTVLILTHRDPDGDALGSALALHLALLKLGKTVDTVFQGTIGDVFSYLPGYDQAKTELVGSNDLVLTVDTRQTGEELQLGYKKLPDEHRIKIIVTPPRGSLKPEDVTIESSLPKYDLIVMLDCSNLDRIGPLKDQFADLFYEVPTISIDHHADNNHFAKVNWVDLTATSTCEILVSLVESLGRDEPLLDADIATCLLTGLITDTGSFQHRPTPKSLTVAAQLVAAGARQQEIIERIYRSITLPRMRLWGRMLAKVQQDQKHKFIWSTITETDMAETGGGAGESSGLANELAKSVGDADFALLLTDRDGEVRGNLRSINPTCNVSEIAGLFGGGGHAAASGFRVKGTIQEKEETILNTIRHWRVPNGEKLPGEQRTSSTG